MVAQQQTNSTVFPSTALGFVSRERNTESMLTEFTSTRDPDLRNELAERYDHIVQWLARKFTREGVLTEDLVQMGRIGLLNALDRYDPNRGAQFVTYAIRMIAGEMKHYFRDCAWSMRVARPLRERFTALPHVEETLSAQLGRSPTLVEMAEYMGTSEEEIVAAIGLGSAYQPRSLNSVYISPSEGWESHEELQDLVGSTDDRLEAVVEFKSLYDALNDLDERKHQIIRRRYFEQWSQSEVARELGISQMHVCRLEHEALDQLRGAIGQEVPLVG